MEERGVKSKGIRRIAYDAARRTLDVEFASATRSPPKVYRYFDVAPEVYEWLSRVESKGRFINRLVRDRYRYERLDPSKADGGVAPGDADDGLLAALEKSLEREPQ